MKNFYFLSGLPRSGSTLLGAILTQNPEIFVTPTSPLLDLLCYTQNSWSQIQQAKTWQDPVQLSNVYSGIVHSIFKHIEQPVLIDKHRAWARNIPAATECFGQKPKIICTVRDVAEVLASFMTLARASRSAGRGNFIDEMIRNKGLTASDDVFCRVLWENYVSDPYQSLRLGFETDRSCLHFVDYADLTQRPEETVAGIYQFLGLPVFAHNFNKISNTIEEKDEFWGFEGLHKIRSQLKRVSPGAEEILGSSLYGKYTAERFEFWDAGCR